MIWYNVTVKIENDVAEDFQSWMTHMHIPDVLATGYFSSSKMSRIINREDKEETTFSIQYACESMKDLHHYQINESERLQAEVKEKYDGKFVSFRSIMEELFVLEGKK